MNLHPLLVHFPIALLTAYAVLELASLLKPIRARTYVFQLKAAMLLLGALAAIPTYYTGFIQLAKIPQDSELYRAVTMHWRFATLSLIVFAFLMLAYVSEWLLREWATASESTKKRLAWSRGITQTAAAPILALGGLACITVTGALGGSLVYGPDIDPAVAFLYHLLVK